jgi:hypothetical protein
MRKTGPLPERGILERARARELLDTWNVTKDKALIERHLAAGEAWYGEGSSERIRGHMRAISDARKNMTGG